MDSLLLKGKTAIITGGSKGIGKATAELFAAEGANVVITARGKEALDDTVNTINGAAGGKAVGVVADVSSEEMCVEIFEKAIKEFGQIDILVANAGIANTWAIDSTTNEDWFSILDVNLNGLFYYCREATKHMVPRDSGVILIISSCAGLKPVSGCSYSTSKGAVNAFAKNLAYRFAGSGIRCNCICPGRIRTPLQDSVKALIAERPEALNMHQYGNQYVRRDIPPLEPEAIAHCALFLSSDYSKDINGVVMPVDRGSYLP